MDDPHLTDDQPVDLEPIDETSAPVPPPRPDASAPGYEGWRTMYLRNSIPCLYLDRSLRILEANASFCALYDCGEQIAGVYFTQFYGASFDPGRSAELFRSVLSADTGYEWHGKVERQGNDNLLTVCKVWILPAADSAGGAPEAYSAICLDMTAEHRQLLQGTFSSLLEAARLKDNDTGRHVERVNLYARVVSELLEKDAAAPAVNRDFVEVISLVAALHDVGKIGTPDDILNKAGKLEAWEWEVMKHHTINGAYILSTYPHPMAREIALYHHERWDGTGYPMGLAGVQIPLAARIVALADVYDALRMLRSYKPAYTHEQAVQSMVEEKGTHFDPFLIERFQTVSERFREIFSDLADAPP